MSDEFLVDKERDELLEKKIKKIFEEYRKEEDYFDSLYYKAVELGKKEEFSKISTLAIWWDNYDPEKYLCVGKVKNWVRLFEEFHKCLKKSREKSKEGRKVYCEPFWFDFYEDFLDCALEGLVRKLKQNVINEEEKEKINPYLLRDILTFKEVIHDPFDGLPARYEYLVEALGLIRAKTSIPFLKKIMEWRDKHDIGEIGQHGEQKYDYTHNIRKIAVIALVEIAGDKEVEFLFKRFLVDGSPTVQETIYYELEKIGTTKSKQYCTKIRNLRPGSDLEYIFGEIYGIPEVFE